MNSLVCSTRSFITVEALDTLISSSCQPQAVRGQLVPPGQSQGEYLNHICSKHVSQLESQNVDGVMLHRPSLKLIMNYEFQMRKEVMEEVNFQVNQGSTLVQALRAIVKNPDIWERYFSTPLAVSSAAQSLREGWGARGRVQERPHTSDSPYAKGKVVKGKGKGKKGDRAKGKTKGAGLHGSTPDGLRLQQQARRVPGRLWKGAGVSDLLGPLAPNAGAPGRQGMTRGLRPAAGGEAAGGITHGEAAVQGSLPICRSRTGHRFGEAPSTARLEGGSGDPGR